MTDMCILMTAAVCHDLDHPGYNNTYISRCHGHSHAIIGAFMQSRIQTNQDRVVPVVELSYNT